MGGHLTRNYQSVNNQSLLDQIKSQKIADIQECFTVLCQDYEHCHYVNHDQFTDIFGPITDDPSEFFLILQEDRDMNDTVDVYESLAIFIIFSADDIDSKISFIFKLFDFDNNGSLDISELFMTLQSATRGMCKLVGMKLPTKKDLEILVESIFQAMDIDRNKKIILLEFATWISNNVEFEEFLAKTTGRVTLPYARKRFINIQSMLNGLFTLAAADSMTHYVSEESLKKILEKEGHFFFNSNQINFILNVLRGTTNDAIHNDSDRQIISKDAYETLSKAWSVFSALDYHNQDKLTINELKTLIWIYEDKEPSETKLLVEMNDIDKNHSGYISRDEWITCFCMPENDGTMIFKKGLRELFEKVDIDGSGFLSYDELKVLSLEAFDIYFRTTYDPEKREYLRGMVDSVTEEVFAELNVDKNNKIEWSEFKNYMKVAAKKYLKLRVFLTTNLTEE